MPQNGTDMGIKKEVNIGNCRLLLGDCIDILPSITQVDAVVTSPPYDDLRDYGNNHNWSFVKFTDIAEYLKDSLKEGGAIAWVVNDAVLNKQESGTSFRQALYFQEIGMRLHDTMIWHKGGFNFPESNRYPQCFEYMFIFAKGDLKTANLIRDRKNKTPLTRKKGTMRKKNGEIVSRLHIPLTIGKYGLRYNVWDITPEKNNLTDHPAPFSVALAAGHVQTWSNEGDTILDPFLGSGTTAVTCMKLNRKFIGIEINEAYFDMAVDRVQREFKQPDIFENL